MSGTVKAPAPGQRRRINFSARFQSAVKVAQALGLKGRLSMTHDGTTVAVDIGNQPVATNPDPKSPLAPWSEVFDDKDHTQIHKPLRR
jgi:hypothetical protein